MSTAPAVLGNLAEAAIGRSAQVLTVGEPAPGFIELGLRAGPPPGGWQPGHEVQFRVIRTKGRRYTVRTIGNASPEHISILAATDAYARDDKSMALIEARPEAAASLAARWPRYLFPPATPTPGEATLTWLAHTGSDALRDLDGAVLLGHAQSIQRQRRALIDRAGLPRGAITVKAYWADGKDNYPADRAAVRQIQRYFTGDTAV